MIKKLVSIDCGYRNFATVLAHVHECGTRADVVKADVTDVLGGKRKRSNFLMVKAVVSHLRALLEEWGVRADDRPSFVCEQQVKGCNIPIGYGVMGFAFGAYPDSEFVFMPAKKKFLGAQPSTAPNLKRAAIDEVKRLIETERSAPETCRVRILAQPRLAYMNLRKKDDLSDCVLQVQSLLYQRSTSSAVKHGATHQATAGRAGPDGDGACGGAGGGGVV
jgi:antitoxin component HigA of HigAB toxin-antitoxin module